MLDFLAGLKDLAIAGAAVTTAIVAVKGLEKWRQEVAGKAHFEVARALARATYRMRDEIQSIRAPFCSAREFPEGYAGSANLSVDEETERPRTASSPLPSVALLSFQFAENSLPQTGPKRAGRSE